MKKSLVKGFSILDMSGEPTKEKLIAVRENGDIFESEYRPYNNTFNARGTVWTKATSTLDEFKAKGAKFIGNYPDPVK